MERGNDCKSDLFDRLKIDSFKQRFPWIGGDLQTLRDTFVEDNLPIESGEKFLIPVPALPSGSAGSGHLLAFLDRPKTAQIRGFVLILHGLGGSSRRRGLRRMSLALLKQGFAVLRLNLRGADPCRKYAPGTYSAKCNSDLIPVIIYARKICKQLKNEILSYKTSLPFFGVGLSLGGTILLNACLEKANSSYLPKPVFDGLACISSPLDLSLCSSSIERPRNIVYQQWLLHRLVRQAIADPFGIAHEEKNKLITSNGKSLKKISSIRSFDSAITAPRWGYKNVNEYYENASPLKKILGSVRDVPPSLFLQSKDDPWVPAESTIELANKISYMKERNKFDFVITSNGGHNGFHGIKGCWGDELVVRWLVSQTGGKFNLI